MLIKKRITSKKENHQEKENSSSFTINDDDVSTFTFSFKLSIISDSIGFLLALPIDIVTYTTSLDTHDFDFVNLAVTQFI